MKPTMKQTMVQMISLLVEIIMMTVAHILTLIAVVIIMIMALMHLIAVVIIMIMALMHLIAVVIIMIMVLMHLIMVEITLADMIMIMTILTEAMIILDMILIEMKNLLTVNNFQFCASNNYLNQILIKDQQMIFLILNQKRYLVLYNCAIMILPYKISNLFLKTETNDLKYYIKYLFSTFVTFP